MRCGAIFQEALDVTHGCGDGGSHACAAWLAAEGAGFETGVGEDVLVAKIEHAHHAQVQANPVQARPMNTKRKTDWWSQRLVAHWVLLTIS